MKKIESEHNFTEEELERVAELSKKLDLLPETVKILYGRGFHDEKSIRDFLTPGRERFNSPFLMTGMREAADRIALARERGERVAVYGDYDCDGICSCAILKRALLDFGVDARVFIPERADGYGLGDNVLERVFTECDPDLIITCDCGITGADAVEKIKKRGCDVVVTDHHELQERLPDCVCVNPKFRDDYPFDALCGAGVAFKVACALLGDRAYEYLDFAAIATIGDSVPLIGENRDIVAEGMKAVSSRRHYCYAPLLNPGEVREQDVSFYLAPRLNAAGRMGHAAMGLELFCSDDKEEIEALASQILAFNKTRQATCDRISASAKAALLKKGRYDKVIILEGSDWETGFVGIAATRVAEEYERPAILLTGAEDLHGSARSVGEINMFEAMKSCSELFTSFGGHAYAAGVGMKKENLPEVERRLNEYLAEHYREEDFSSPFRVCEAPDEFSPRFFEELKALEPYGVGNKKPLFSSSLRTATIKPSKEGATHCAFFSGGMDFVYFGGEKFSQLIESSAQKRVVFECDSHTFRGRDYASAIVRCLEAKGAPERGEIELSALKTLAAGGKKSCEKISVEDAQKRLDDAKTLGTIFLAQDLETLSRYKTSLRTDFFAPQGASLETALVVSPQWDLDLTGYREVVYLDDVETCPFKTDGDIFSTDIVPAWTKKIETRRETLLGHYSTIKRYSHRYLGADPFKAAGEIKELSPLQAAFDLVVFEEMGLISFSSGEIVFYEGRGSLENSPTYLAVRRYDSFRKDQN